MKESLYELISLNQSAFVLGRRIADNILLTQELMHNYHLDRGPARCAFKVDIQKAYDTVDWLFLKDILMGFGFHHRMIGWIMECVTTTSFSLSINGCSHGFFKEYLEFSPFEEGTLPVKHLGVPLVPSRLVTQLIRSVLGSMHVYWASVFILPSSLMHDLEQVIRGFLWCQGEMKRGKAKVAWEVVCLPKKEGGLGIRRLEVFNKALISSHIWSIITNKESLWVKWVHLYKLNGRSFWDIPLRGNIPLRALSYLISNRDIYRAGLGLDTRVSDIVLAGSWVWPTDWLVKYPPLANIVVPNLTNAADCSTWLNRQNMEVGYSVAAVWECIRPRNNEIDWFNVVWFNHQIPRHAIHLWLLDTHEHLFFKCRFSFQVWECLKSLTSITGIPLALNSIVDFIIPLAHRKSARSVTLKHAKYFEGSCFEGVLEVCCSQ
ncbi:SPX and EXS domain-containing protein [Tanacetum coccineum]